MTQGSNSTVCFVEVRHGLLTVCYNLGDGPNTVTLPDHKIDTGEWNDVGLERMQNEFTLRFNGGGEHREITAAHGTYKEIKVDPRGAILGSINQSGYQGCIKNARLNGCRLPMENTTASPVSVISREGATEGCVSDVCSSSPCSRRFVCIDLWMNHECRYQTTRAGVTRLQKTLELWEITLCFLSIPS
ncbi:protocadherin Fat 1-like [Spea bombifrons]|uniref:protocadherin Fat 1-like n=1 Tax=Spea bombifrons TaxID=233779 RepID=UPI00234AE42A|nr:protocadherin Fat 1-like [Spea bombifrons]